MIFIIIILILIVSIVSYGLWDIFKKACDEESKYLDELEKDTRQ